MSLALAEIGLDAEDPLRDALALAQIARDCAASGVERRALHLRLSLLPKEQRQPRHLRLIREALAPVLRPTRARLFELPGGDVVVLSPPPGEHLMAARAAVARLLPDHAADRLLPTMRLPAEAALLLTAIEGALGLAPPQEAAPAAPALSPPAPGAMEAALRGLAQADLSAHLRRRTAWRLPPGAEEAQPLGQEWLLDQGGLWCLLLPGTAPGPAQALAFRRFTERRLLAALARPEEARQMGPATLRLSLGTLEEAEFLRLEALLGPLGRRDLQVAVPLGEALADPAAFARLRRFGAARGWALGLDEVPHAALPLLPLGRLALPLLRLRFDPAILRADAASRAALDAALPEDRATLALAGADVPAAIAWGWQRGITRFTGALLKG